MSDPTEQVRREMVTEINSQAAQDRAEAEAKHGKVWNTAEMQAEFTVLGFMAPFTVVSRKSDGARGTLTFQHNPRFYFDFTKDAS